MNENIGAKGGNNDRKRQFKILKRNKEKMTQEELELLEKKVKKRQLINILTLIPIAILGAITSTIASPSITNTRKRHQKNNKLENQIDTEREEQVENEIDSHQENKINIQIGKNNVLPQENIKIENEEIKIDYNHSLKEEIVEKDKDVERLDNEIAKIKTKKILEEYEEKLKELRYKLRNNYYEQSILDEAKYLEENPSDENLEKLNQLIDKLEKYKEIIKINTAFLEENNYIEELVEEDIEKIKEQTTLTEDSISDIFKSIDNKVEEIKKIETIVKETLEETKINKNVNEEQLDELKEKKQDIEIHATELEKFQEEEAKINAVIQEKIKKDVNIFERERIELSGMALGSNLAVRNIRNNMRSTGVRSGRKIFNFITTYLYYFSMINAIKPIKKRYKRIDIEKYRKTVETSIEEIDKVLDDIGKTSKKLDKTIKEFMIKYAKYSDTKEYKRILDNLIQMNKSLQEKEYEIEQIRKEEEKKYQYVDEESKVYRL